MASIDTGSEGKEGGKVRAKKMAVHIDFTPMVDLGFLLITFFMLTTTMNKPQVMEINMPLKEDVPPEDRTKFKESQTMTIVLGDRNVIYYYFGITNPVLDSTNFGKDCIRKVLLEESTKRNPSVDSIATYKRQLDDRIIKREDYKKNISRIKGYKDGLIVVIKAEDKSKYRNLVDILDEMSVCNIGRYAIVDITDQDKELIAGTLPTTN